MMLSLLLACQIQPPKEQSQVDTDSAPSADDTSDGQTDTDTDTDTQATPSGRTVVLLTVDTLNRNFVHTSINGEPITPELDRLFEESAYLPNTLVTRGQTSPFFGVNPHRPLPQNHNGSLKSKGIGSGLLNPS